MSRWEVDSSLSPKNSFTLRLLSLPKKLTTVLLNMPAWDDVEKEQFQTEFLKHGRGKWTKIAEGIPTRTRHQVQSYAFHMARENSAEMEELVRLYEANENKVVTAGVGEGPWDDVEKEQFRTEFLKHGRGKWTKIAEGIPTRSSKQVKSYAFHMARDRSAEMEELVRLYEANKDKVVTAGPPVPRKGQESGSESKMVFGMISTRDLARRVRPKLDIMCANLEDSIQRKEQMSPDEREVMSDIGGIITSAFRSNQSAESAGVSAAKQLIKLLESKKTTAV